MSSEPSLIPLAVVFPLCLAAAVSDLRTYRIPKSIWLGLLVSGPVHHVSTSGGPGLAFALLGAVFGFALLFGPYLAGGMGAGDVKLLAGVGAWIGLKGVTLVASAALCAVASGALILAWRRGGLSTTFAGVGRILATGRARGDLAVENALALPDRATRVVPFAPAALVGLTFYGMKILGIV